jgi:hypothetical protein
LKKQDLNNRRYRTHPLFVLVITHLAKLSSSASTPPLSPIAMASQGYLDKVNDFCDKLRQRRIHGSLAAAKGTAELLRQLVASSRLHDPKTMLEEVKKVGIRIQCALPIGTLLISNATMFIYVVSFSIVEPTRSQLALFFFACWL